MQYALYLIESKLAMLREDEHAAHERVQAFCTLVTGLRGRERDEVMAQIHAELDQIVMLTSHISLLSTLHADLVAGAASAA